MVLVRPVSTVGLIACFVLYLFWDGRHTQAERNNWILLGEFCVLAVVIGVQFRSQSRLQCPSCHHSLTNIALVFAWTRSKPAACPHCGVSFDDPMPASNERSGAAINRMNLN